MNPKYIDAAIMKLGTLTHYYSLLIISLWYSDVKFSKANNYVQCLCK